MIGTILLILNYPQNDILKILDKTVNLLKPGFEVIVWSSSSIKRYQIDNQHYKRSIIDNNVKGVLINTNKYETGMQSNFIFHENTQRDIIVSLEGPLGEDFGVFLDKIQNVCHTDPPPRELSIDSKNHCLSFVCYEHDPKKAKVASFSSYRPLFMSQNQDKILLTTSPEIVSALGIEAYEIPPNSLVFWPSNKQSLPESATKRRIHASKHFMKNEIHETPYTLKRVYAFRNHKTIKTAAEIITNSKRIYVIGNGSSLNAGLGLQYLLPELDISGISAFEFLLYQLPSLEKGHTIIAITQSGSTWDVIEAVEKGKKAGANIISITNNPLGKIREYSDVTIPILAGYELAIPATKSFTNTLAILHLLASQVKAELGILTTKEREEKLLAISTFADKVPNLLHHHEKWAQNTAKELCDLKGGYIISAGITYPVAIEGALKLKEVAYSHAEPIELEEYLHGPSAALSKEMYNIVISPYERAGRERFLQQLEKFHNNIGKFVVIGGTSEEYEKLENISIAEIKQKDPILYALTSTLLIQLLSYWLGIYRKTPIDFPKGLSKAVVE
ncbi:hypothetical protein EP1X_01340 [Thermococcus sp. EP1]|uniref:SIS domain-containing protein n=1 Tax=Thermococcus sp. EP1 TaxID=1591054 RepID=UPI0006DA74CB|nr:SIS domain-containing protein [Thermococcus sp. EP1]KPU63865.1 hypothetical protein EP1X_01340 [Thermococcus sp. EP1]